jgi:hypothetical protein
MSAINGLGQGVYQYFQNVRVTSTHEIATPVTEGDPEGDGNDGASAGNKKKGDLFGMALLSTLAKHGVDAEEFQRDFLATLHKLSGGLAGEEQKVPFSAVG